MSKRSLYLLPVCVLLCGLLLTSAWAADPPTDTFGGRLATYDKAVGESYFALSIRPQRVPKSARLQDVVVLVREGSGYVIDDIEFSGAGPFNPPGRLSDALDQAGE